MGFRTPTIAGPRALFRIGDDEVVALQGIPPGEADIGTTGLGRGELVVEEQYAILLLDSAGGRRPGIRAAQGLSSGLALRLVMHSRPDPLKSA